MKLILFSDTGHPPLTPPFQHRSSLSPSLTPREIAMQITALPSVTEGPREISRKITAEENEHTLPLRPCQIIRHVIIRFH